MIEIRETLPRVFFDIITNIPMFEDPALDSILHELPHQKDSPLDRLQSFTEPIVDETGFFQNTGFKHLFITFSLDNTPQLKHKITLSASKADRYVAVSRKFFHEEALTALRLDFFAFALEHVRDMLSVLCKKYDLDSRPLNKLLQSKDDPKLFEDNQLADTIIEEHRDNELRIHIRLIDDQFGGLNEIDGHAQFIDEIEQLLEEKDLGKIDGCELGIGYRDIYCSGDDATAMHKCIAKRLKSLPAGSYIEVVKDGEIERIELGMN